ncbi:PD-(D/E)XK nuclease family protein [Salarchaeum japonicum]|uniref:PD-(D/E)XK nuclease family protein n=1 Tax=Salarchaeum japonicum TaxID=555573 RepID=UPI003C78BAFD
MDETDYQAQLEGLRGKLNNIERPPETTLEILGQSRVEQRWEELLVYFLDSTNPHRFDTDVLRAFLRAVHSHGDTSMSGPLRSLETVEVSSQVSTDDGIFDILLRQPDEWFVCIELKVDSPETNAQTERYADATRLGDIDTRQYSGTDEYVYIAPKDAPDSVSEDFVDISWEQIVAELETVLTDGFGKYPTKSSAQLADFIDTIQLELNMGDINQISDETVLYTEYAETINRVRDAFERDKERLYNSLEETFFAEFGHEGWVSNTRPNTYIQLYKPEWRDVGSGTNIEYEPHLSLNQKQPTIRLRLDIEHTGKAELREKLSSRVSQETFEDAGWEYVNGAYALVAKSLPLDIENPQASIQAATEEIQQLHSLVGEPIEEIVNEYTDS